MAIAGPFYPIWLFLVGRRLLQLATQIPRIKNLPLQQKPVIGNRPRIVPLANLPLLAGVVYFEV